MLLIHLYKLIIWTTIWITIVHCENDKSTETNEIIPKEAISKLDPSVRQALLKAIDKLEKEAAAEQDTSDEYVESREKNDVNDEILEESTTSDIIPTVQFYTAAVDEKLSKPETLLKFIQKSKDAKKPTTTTDTVRPTLKNISPVTTNEISSQEEITFQITKPKFPAVKKRPPTTTTTTTTTTPKPTHNEDGENIEVVSQQDIKIYEAPLVTAFTVQQDEKGTPNRVIPIITAEVPKSQRLVAHLPGPTIERLKVVQSQSQQTTSNSALLPTPLPTEPSPPPVPNASSGSNNFQNRLPIPAVLKSNVGPVQTHNNFVSTIIPTQNQEVNNFLLERQRQLEQQIYQLQLQARQQQEQIFQQLKLLEEQRRNNESPKVDFTIRPSVEFIAPPATQSPEKFPFPSEQQLPIKESNNFRFNPVHFFNGHQQQQQQPPQQENHPVQIQQSNQLSFLPTPSFLQPFQQQQPQPQPPIQAPLEAAPFQHLPQRNYQQFNQVAPLVSIPFARLPETVHQQNLQNRVRHFRQETTTGNFGLNTPPAQFHQPQPQPQSQHQQGPNGGGNTLQNILFQSALNHGINPYIPQNFRYPGQ